ncbi:hypothetical protein D1831_00970 [Lactiplantibacillus garii]|uniref:Integral membrane protein n=1 Tax=Lactiplantibacillus garii TaxID=2306423 RepID=A0A426DAQ4_9LACO|nr:TIGR03766 family XrtG-associated glycosyltransferase [Lactiplantibacillus garii]RRK11677.1 hypothetical protein D1831_00970 [Lactiplantibacillus garii]
MRKRLFRIGNWALIALFNGLFFLTLFDAVTSPNLILGDNKVTGAGTTMWTTGCLIAAAAILISWQTSWRVKRLMKWLFKTHALATATVLLALTVGWQLVFVLAVHPPIGFDAGAIHQALHDTTSAEIRAYFSLNYNNLPMLLAEVQLAKWFGTTSWLFFDLVTLVLVDLSALLNLICIVLVEPRKLVAGMNIHAVWLLLFPTIIVPYTDAWVLPLVSLYLLGAVVMVKPRLNLGWRALGALLFSVGLVGAYRLKPSAIVAMVALVIVGGLFALRPRRLAWPSVGQTALVLLLAAGLTAGCYAATAQLLKRQTYIQVDQSREIPAIHFISMGVSGDGGYNAKDALKMAELPNKQARVAYSKRVLIQRLKRRGAWGYARFLVAKHRNNTADGTFAWVKEGHFINENPIPKRGGFSGWLRSFVYLYGTRLGDLRFMSQVWWVVWLALIAFAWRDQRTFVQALRLTIIGGFSYLLIFEGGRSRYLIQFLPAFLMLATLVYQESFNWFYRAHRWFTKAP